MPPPLRIAAFERCWTSHESREVCQSCPRTATSWLAGRTADGGAVALGYCGSHLPGNRRRWVDGITEPLSGFFSADELAAWEVITS